RHHRNVDLRKNILRHNRDGRDAEKHNEGGQDVEGVRKLQRKSNDTHGDLLILAARPSATKWRRVSRTLCGAPRKFLGKALVGVTRRYAGSKGTATNRVLSPDL